VGYSKLFHSVLYLDEASTKSNVAEPTKTIELCSWSEHTQVNPKPSVKFGTSSKRFRGVPSN